MRIVLSNTWLAGFPKMEIYIVAFMTCTIMVCLYVTYQCFLAPLAVFPGPVLAKLTRIWYAYRTKSGLWHRDLMKLHAKYGSVVRIAPNELSVADPQAHKEIYRAARGFVKPPIFNMIKGHRTFDLAAETNPDVHAFQRKLVSRAYTMESIRNLQPAVDLVINALMKRFDELDGQVIDLGYWLQAFSFDVIGTVSFSQSFGFVDTGTGQDVLAKVQRALKSVGWLMNAPWLWKLHNAVMPIIGNLIPIHDRNGHFFDMSIAAVESWKKRVRTQKDMLGHLVEIQKAKPELDDISIKYMMSSNIFAGADTTSTSLRGIVLILLRHSDKLQYLMRELEDKRAKGELSDLVTFEEAEACPYLQAVIHEGMRLHPAIGSTLPRVVPEGGMNINGNFVQAGSNVGSCAWVIHRLPQIWGPDASEFRPERWLDTKERIGELKRFYFPFGSGSRTCIGRNLSLLQIGKLLATLLLRFHMSLVDEDKVFEEYGVVAFIKGLQVKLEKRPQLTLK